MAACHIEPDDKKALVSRVGQKLVEKHGKKKYYAPADVRRARMDAGYPIDVECWALVAFTSVDDFNMIHQAAGEVCDYAAMKASILTELAGTESFWLPDIGLSWLEWPDVDLSSLFDWFDFS